MVILCVLHFSVCVCWSSDGAIQCFCEGGGNLQMLRNAGGL